MMYGRDQVPAFSEGCLSGMVALVTGAGSSGGLGTGQAIAATLGRAGAAVVVNDIDEAAAEATVELLVRDGVDGVSAIGDVSSEESAREIADTAVRRHGRIDVLVNNVGIVGPSADIVELPIEQWDRVIAVNVRSIVAMSRAVLPCMRAGSSIVNISSVGAWWATDRPAYTASKGAINALTLSMAGQHGAAGVRVNAVAPGMMWTPLIERAAPSAEVADALRRNRAAANLLRQEGTPWDIGAAVLFLASPYAGWITGHVLVVDGGALSVRPFGTTLSDLVPPHDVDREEAS